MIPIKDNYTKIRYGPDSGRPDKDLWDKKSILDRPSGPVDRDGESLRFQVSIVRR